MPKSGSSQHNTQAGNSVRDFCSPMRELDDALLSRQAGRRNQTLLVGSVFLFSLVALLFASAP